MLRDVRWSTIGAVFAITWIVESHFTNSWTDLCMCPDSIVFRITWLLKICVFHAPGTRSIMLHFHLLKCNIIDQENVKVTLCYTFMKEKNYLVFRLVTNCFVIFQFPFRYDIARYPVSGHLKSITHERTHERTRWVRSKRSPWPYTVGAPYMLEYSTHDVSRIWSR